MRVVDWLRVAVCGLIAGTVWTLLSAVLVAALGGDLLAAVAQRQAGALPAGSGIKLYFLSVAAGVWAMWVYAFVRRRIDSNVKAGIAAGLAWWVIASLQSLKWVVVLGIPTSAWLPLTANAAASVLATVAGAVLCGALPPDGPSASAHDPGHGEQR